MTRPAVKVLTRDRMNVIPGYWDPQELRFIEEELQADILTLVLEDAPASHDGGGTAASGASARRPRPIPAAPYQQLMRS